MPPIQYRSQVMDHLDLVAGMCKELGIADDIDRRAPKYPMNGRKFLEGHWMNCLSWMSVKSILSWLSR